MNTQRPEWNDANNALVGHGASMVTLCYLRRFQQFVARLFRSLGDAPVMVSEEVAIAAGGRHADFRSDTRSCSTVPCRGGIGEPILNDLGEAGSRYRMAIYEHGFSERRSSVAPSAARGILRTLARFCRSLDAGQPSRGRVVSRVQSDLLFRGRGGQDTPPVRDARRAGRRPQFGTLDGRSESLELFVLAAEQPARTVKISKATCCIPIVRCLVSWPSIASRPSELRRSPHSCSDS